MKLTTTRFGEIEIDESKLLTMKEGGILGFERLRRFALIHHRQESTPFMWLQSVEDGSVAFVVMNAFSAMPDYAPALDDTSAQSLAIREPEDTLLLAIITIRSNPARISANLKAPLVINARRRWAKQVIIEDPDYPVQHDLTVGTKRPDHAADVQAIDRAKAMASTAV